MIFARFSNVLQIWSEGKKNQNYSILQENVTKLVALPDPFHVSLHFFVKSGETECKKTRLYLISIHLRGCVPNVAQHF